MYCDVMGVIIMIDIFDIFVVLMMMRFAFILPLLFSGGRIYAV